MLGSPLALCPLMCCCCRGNRVLRSACLVRVDNVDGLALIHRRVGGIQQLEIVSMTMAA